MQKMDNLNSKMDDDPSIKSGDICTVSGKADNESYLASCETTHQSNQSNKHSTSQDNKDTVFLVSDNLNNRDVLVPVCVHDHSGNDNERLCVENVVNNKDTSKTYSIENNGRGGNSDMNIVKTVESNVGECETTGFEQITGDGTIDNRTKKLPKAVQEYQFYNIVNNNNNNNNSNVKTFDYNKIKSTTTDGYQERLSKSVETLPQITARNGYLTFGGSNSNISHQCNNSPSFVTVSRIRSISIGSCSGRFPITMTATNALLPADDKVKFSLRSMSWRQRLMLFNLIWVCFASSTCFSLLAPFFPQEAEAKGVSQTVIGLIFGFYELVVFLTCPVFGIIMNKIDCKFLFVSGIFTAGTCGILFGVLDRAPDGTVYIVMCFLCRSVEALGTAAFMTAAYAIAASEFKMHVSLIVGALETFTGLGFMIGPPIGGALYELGGFGLPFFVLGSLLILTSAISLKLMPTPEITQPLSSSSVSIWKFFFNTGVVMITLSVVSGGVALSVLDPILADRLEPFGLSPTLVGLVFVISPGIYAITGPCWGWLGDTKGCVYTMIIAGNIISGVAFVFLGPAPFLDLPFTLWLNIASLFVYGFFIGCSFIMTFKAYNDISIAIGFKQNMVTFGLISGLFNSAFSFGAFLGPTVGGILDDYFGFEIACVVVAIILIFTGLATLLYRVLCQKCSCGIPSTNAAYDESISVAERERQPLLSDTPSRNSVQQASKAGVSC